MAQYYRRFVLGFSDVARPMFELLKQSGPGVRRAWREEHQQAFKQLKEALVKAPCLAFPDWRRDFVLYTDASQYGLGAVLSQHQEQGEVVTAYMSRLMDKHERRYTVSEKEMLAVVWAMRKFRHYIFGRHVNVVTDHRALTCLHNLKDPHGRLARWALTLSEHDYTVVYRRGRDHHNADALSRVLWGKSIDERMAAERGADQSRIERAVETVVAAVRAGVVSSEEQDRYEHGEDLEADGSMWDELRASDMDPTEALTRIKDFQRADQTCRDFIDYLERQHLPEQGEDVARRREVVLAQHPDFHMRDGLLYRWHRDTRRGMRRDEFAQVVVPMELRKVVL